VLRFFFNLVLEKVSHFVPQREHFCLLYLVHLITLQQLLVATIGVGVATLLNLVLPALLAQLVVNIVIFLVFLFFNGFVELSPPLTFIFIRILITFVKVHSLEGLFIKDRLD
jgi:hypothetical protein